MKIITFEKFAPGTVAVRIVVTNRMYFWDSDPL
jgi:hypothetical protein